MTTVRERSTRKNVCSSFNEALEACRENFHTHRGETHRGEIRRESFNSPSYPASSPLFRRAKRAHPRPRGVSATPAFVPDSNDPRYRSLQSIALLRHRGGPLRIARHGTSLDTFGRGEKSFVLFRKNFSFKRFVRLKYFHIHIL